MGLFSRDNSGIRVTIAARTDVGRTRGHNEDSYLVADLTAREATTERGELSYALGPKGALLLVADGMGGASAGEVASRMATTIVFECLERSWCEDPESTPEAFARHVRSSVEATNTRIHQRSQQDIELDGMGTTSTVVGVLGSNLLVTQVGDSRAYVVRDGVATQLSRDQSYAQHLVDTGRVTEEQALEMVNSNVILQALGPSPTVEVVQTWEPLMQGDTVLLCSDGLSGQVRAEEIAGIVSSGPNLAKHCARLVDLANERGGPDNITVVIARFTGNGLVSPEEAGA